MPIQSYPLHWPEGWPRTKFTGSDKFSTTLAKAMDNVEDALHKFAKDSGKYAALPPPVTDWRAVLEVKQDATREQIEQNYKRLRSEHHPDKGGNPDRFDEIQKAYQQAITC